ncbi:MAG: hypothetical protein E6J20_07175 [Chloroflexi bacterium]|nr:MAG: hypothetical protein E6J20_07175 [Chloroflexota bacterium]
MAVGAVAVAGAAVIVTASAAGMSFGLRQSASPQSAGANLSAAQATASSAACGDFMSHFAVEIKKSQAEINAAFQKAIADTLADEVKSGQITQTQADAIKQKLANQTPCTLPSTIGHAGSKTDIAAYMQQYVTAAAAALGLSATQLKTDLAGGQSLSQVAAAQHVSEADFRTKLIANLKPALDKAVTDKKLTSQQETLIVQRLQTAPLPLWNAPVHKPKPAATATPATP